MRTHLCHTDQRKGPIRTDRTPSGSPAGFGECVSVFTATRSGRFIGDTRWSHCGGYGERVSVEATARCAHLIMITAYIIIVDCCV